MKKINILKDSSLKNNDRSEDNQQINDNNKKSERVLCNHCGRTVANGIRCLGICVADNDY